MPQIDKERFFKMASCYDRMTSYLVPRYDMLQSEIVELLFSGNQPPRTIVDLGAGSGIFLERVLSRDLRTRAVWVDYSGDFRAVAERRLARYVDRVQWIQLRLEEPWEERLECAPDAICSMSAIHHLVSAEKKRLYRRCFDALAPGGWFYNIDEMAAPWEDAYRNTLHYWVSHVEAAGAALPPELRPDYDAWCERFAGWKERNVDNLGLPKQPGDDIHEGYVEQLDWLREVGFVEVDLFVKFQLHSAIGGRKPPSGR